MLNTRKLLDDYKNTRKIKNNIEKRKHYYELPPIQSRLGQGASKPKSSFTQGEGEEEYEEARTGFYSESTRRRHPAEQKTIQARSPGRKQTGSKRLRGVTGAPFSELDEKPHLKPH